MDLKKKLVTGGLWMGFTTILISFLSYLYRFILIKNLTIEDYGLYYAIVTIFLFATVFVDMGLTVSFLKYGSEYLTKGKKGVVKFLVKDLLKFKIKSGAIFIIIIIILSKFLAKYYFKEEKAALLFIAIGIIYVLINVFFSFLNTYFKIFNDLKSHSLYDLIRMVLQVIFLIMFLKLGLWGVVLALITGQIVSFLIFFLLTYNKYFKELIKLKEEKNKRLIKFVRSFAYTNLLFFIGSYILSYTDTYMLTYFRTLTEVGLYNVAVPTSRVVLFFSSAIVVLLIPLTAKLKTEKKFDLLNKLINTLYKISLLFLLPIALILIAYPKLVLKVLYSQEYIAASIPLQILSLSTIFIILFTINTFILNGLGKPKINSKIIIYGTIINIILNLIFIPLWGMTGAAFATLIGYFLMSIISTMKLKNNISKLKIEKSYVWKFVLVSIAFLYFTNTLKKVLIINNKWIETIIVLSISGVIYFLLIFITRIITFKDLKETKNLLLKK